MPTRDDPSSSGALDRADHLRDDPEALSALWAHARVILLTDDGQALADADGVLYAPLGEDLSQGPGGTGAAIFLGKDGDGRAWFALDAALTAANAPNCIDLRTAAAQWPAFDACVFAQARALQHWRTRHRYCGVCGGEIGFSRGGWLGRCGGCGLEHYPRTDPAVIVAVTDGKRLLLGRQAGWAPRRYSVLAGFVEPGESLEQTVAREVLEESAVRVRASRYLASQPWPFPGQLMLGFIALAHPDEPRVDDELEDARWFSVDEIRAAVLAGDDEPGDGLRLSPSISISRWLIDYWLAAMDEAASGD
ncbi:NAD(+) diphosphatase [Lysobacter sp. A289]